MPAHTKNPHGAKQPVSAAAGFTLIELLVVMAIFIIMTGILVANHRKFSYSLDLDNLAYDIGLTIRQAQTYGLAVQGVGADPNQFQKHYGIHFENGTQSGFTMFVDLPPYDNRYDSSVELLQKYDLKNGYTFVAICSVSVVDNTETCPPTGATSLDIVFRRPDPDATLTFYGSSNISAARIRVKLQSPEGRKRGIDVWQTGQISIVDAN